MIIPGGIDPHTHMEFPFMGTHSRDNFDLGSKAALSGGTTSFIDFCFADKGAPLETGYDKWKQKANGKVNCDYSMHCAITEWKP